MLHLVAAVLTMVLLVGCGEASKARPEAAAPAPAVDSALDRSRQVEQAVGRWAAASTLADAKADAERARNLITGPHVTGAGDGDGNGKTEPVSVGLLPGDDGSAGLSGPPASGCVQRDVLGGSWAQPERRWADVLGRIARYSPTNNEFPGLPSHAQRVVGWASLTLAATTLDEALEYSGHAVGHARIVTDALREPTASPCPG